MFKSIISIFLIGLIFTLSACQEKRDFSLDNAIETEKSSLDIILERKTIRVGTTGDYMPFSYKEDENENQFSGIDIELAKNLADTLNVELEFVSTSWPRLMDDLLADKFDIGMSGISITLDRQKLAMFSDPIQFGGKAAISRNADADKYISLAKINNPEVKVIFNPGGTNEQFARDHFPLAQLILNKDNITIFEKIVSGEADVMVTDAIETIIQQEIHPELEAINPKKPFNYSEKGYLIKRDSSFKAYIDQWVNMRLKDGTYQNIYEKEISKSVRENLSNH